LKQNISDPNDDLPHMFPTKDVFETHMQKLGLNNDHIVIIYDNSPLLSSARCWFLLRYFGHKEIFILSGGIKSWKKNSFVTTNEVSNISFGNFKATEENKNLLIKIEEMKNISDNKFFPILDARSFERFSGRGKEPRPNLESGHIPNSLNLPASKLLRNLSRQSSVPLASNQIFVDGLMMDGNTVSVAVHNTCTIVDSLGGSCDKESGSNLESEWYKLSD